MRLALACLLAPFALLGCFIPDRPTADFVVTTDAHILGQEAVRNVRIDGRPHDVRLGHFPFMYEWYGMRPGTYTVTFDVGDETLETVVETSGTPSALVILSDLELTTIGSVRVVEGPRLASPEGRPALRVNVMRSGIVISVVDVRLDGMKADEFSEGVCPVWTWHDLKPGKYSLRVERINGTIFDQTIEVLESGGALVYGMELVSVEEERVRVIDDAVRIRPPFDFDDDDGDIPGIPDYVRLGSAFASAR